MIDLTFQAFAPWALLLGRVVVGVVMLYFGIPKMRDLRANAQDFTNMGFKPGMLFGTLIAFLEFFGGIAMILGFLAELVAIAMAFMMIVGTAWKLKVKKGFPEYSYDLLILALCLIILTLGPGELAILPLP